MDTNKLKASFLFAVALVLWLVAAVIFLSTPNVGHIIGGIVIAAVAMFAFGMLWLAMYEIISGSD